jgi:hypothetical protein
MNITFDICRRFSQLYQIDTLTQNQIYALSYAGIIYSLHHNKMTYADFEGVYLEVSNDMVPLDEYLTQIYDELRNTNYFQ